jgi:tetratricopeptide (TPR) repeat protein
MTLDPYSSCPCGSGKKFKWCCQPLYAGINHAFDQEAQGQHETALRLMDKVVAEHGGNPEAWGQQAKLLYENGKVEEAEAALERAFALNPNYPFGLLLRAHFRFQEGELSGALLLARRAAEHYAPDARDFLADVYYLIFECEMRLRRPVAARAALRLVTHYQPADEGLRDAFDNAFNKPGRLPAAARRDYVLLPPAATTAGDRRAAWDRAAEDAGRLSDLARVFDKLTADDPGDAAAWFNLGLARAWLGDNRAALDALDRYLGLETDDGRATVAATLTEVLRCGQGLEDDCDYHEHSFAFSFQDPQPVLRMLEDWKNAGRLLPPPQQQEGVFFTMVLEMTTAPVITVGAPAADLARLAGYLMISQLADHQVNVVRVWSPIKDSLGRLREEVRQRAGLNLGEAREVREPINFHDVVLEALVFPTGTPTQATAERVLNHVATFFEEKWAHRPRRSLAGNTPTDAAGHATLRKKLRGVIQFVQDCAEDGMVQGYDFDRLRRKLGLLGPAPAAPGAPLDVTALGAAELAALAVESLSEGQLEQAYQAAQKLDADELSAHFARALVARPPSAERPDRYPWYSYLTQRALKEGNLDEALDHVNEGERVDCEGNEGRRRDDYELRRGQVHVKRGEADAAQDVFQRLIDRVPTNLKYRGSAAEAMLTLKQGARALRFAEEGLERARQQNDRDSEQYLQELVGAAKRQLG